VTALVVRDLAHPPRVKIDVAAGGNHNITVEHFEKPVANWVEAKAIMAKDPARYCVPCPHGEWWR
jgi:hypothetical protein